MLKINIAIAIISLTEDINTNRNFGTVTDEQSKEQIISIKIYKQFDGSI